MELCRLDVKDSQCLNDQEVERIRRDLRSRGTLVNTHEPNEQYLCLDPTPLMFAVSAGDHAMVRFLIERGADVNAACASTGMTPLMEGYMMLGTKDRRHRIGKQACCTILLDAGASLAAVDSRGWSAQDYKYLNRMFVSDLDLCNPANIYQYSLNADGPPATVVGAEGSWASMSTVDPLKFREFFYDVGVVKVGSIKR